MRWSTRSPPSACGTSRCRQPRSDSGAQCAMATRSNGTDSARHRAQAEIHVPEEVIPAFAGTTNHLEGAMKKSFVRGTWQVKRAFSPCVITEGASRTIYIAGHTGQIDDAGKSLAGDFDTQFKQTFRNIEKTLAEAGAKLSDMVTMTVFLIDARYTTRITEIRREIFGDNFAGSAAITVAGFADPSMIIEIQGVAVL